MDINTNEEIEIDLLELLKLIINRLWIIILSGAIVALAAGLYSNYMVTPTYISKTQLYVMNKSEATTSLSDMQIGAQLTQDYTVMVKSRHVVNRVIENLNLDTSYEDMVKKISISNPSTRILEIKVSYHNAYLAKRIVDEIAHVSMEHIANIMDTGKPSIVDEGNIPTQPSSPNVLKNGIIGGILGAMMAAGIVLVMYMLDDTIKGSEDIERHLGLSTLGFIPIEAGMAGRVKRDKINRKNNRENNKKIKKAMKVNTLNNNESDED